MQHGPQRAEQRRRVVGVLHLAQDLRLSDDQGIEARSHAEHVADRLLVPVGIHVRCEAAERYALLLGDERPNSGVRCRDVRRMRDHLHPVARGHEGALADDLGIDQAGKRPVARGVAERQLLAEFQRRGVVVQADDQQRRGR